jgi:hypothetical protein
MHHSLRCILTATPSKKSAGDHDLDLVTKRNQFPRRLTRATANIKDTARPVRQPLKQQIRVSRLRRTKIGRANLEPVPITIV